MISVNDNPIFLKIIFLSHLAKMLTLFLLSSIICTTIIKREKNKDIKIRKIIGFIKLLNIFKYITNMRKPRNNRPVKNENIIISIG